jgi:hypothetical protein
MTVRAAERRIKRHSSPRRRTRSARIHGSATTDAQERVAPGDCVSRGAARRIKSNSSWRLASARALQLLLAELSIETVAMLFDVPTATVTAWMAGTLRPSKVEGQFLCLLARVASRIAGSARRSGRGGARKRRKSRSSLDPGRRASRAERSGSGGVSAGVSAAARALVSHGRAARRASVPPALSGSRRHGPNARSVVRLSRTGGTR